MKRISSIFVILLFCSFCFAQGDSKIKELDNLRQQLAQNHNDTSRVLVLCSESNYYQFVNADSSLFYAQEALTLARQINYPKGECAAFYRLGFEHGVLGNYTRALEMQLKALRIAERINWSEQKVEILQRLGVIYRDAKDYPKSLKYIYQSISLADSIHYYEMLTASQNIMAYDYLILNKLDSAFYYAQEVKNNIKHYKVEFMKPPNLNTLGVIEVRRGNINAALDYLHKSLIEADKSNNFEISAASNFDIATIYQEQDKVDSSIIYALKSLEFSKKGKLYSRIERASNLLAELYEPIDKNKESYYINLANLAKDSLLNFNNKYVLENLMNFDEKERQYEIQVAKTSERNRLRIIGLLAGFMTALCVGYILFRNNKKKHRAYTKLEKTLKELKATQNQLIQSEKLASLGELTAGIAHEIQNPLNFVNNFSEFSVSIAKELNIEMNKIDIDKNYIEELLRDLSSNQEKINYHGKRASSIVKGMLEHSRESSGKKELTDINKLCDEYFRLSYHGLRAKDKEFNATLISHFDDKLPKIEIIPQDVGRVILNLINNAFYAVNERKNLVPTISGRGLDNQKYEPTVTVQTLHTTSHIEIRVKDNGTGMSEAVRAKIFQPFFTTKPTGLGTGLGLSLAYDIITKGHGGTLTVESTEGVGSEFVIQLLI